MIRRPPRSTLFPLHDALPISSMSFITHRERKGPKEDIGCAAWTLVGCAVRLRVSPDSDRTPHQGPGDRKSTRLNSSHSQISYAVFCLKKKKLSSLHTD